MQSTTIMKISMRKLSATPPLTALSFAVIFLLSLMPFSRVNAQTITHDGQIVDKLLYAGKHTWRNEEGLQIAEVIYDAEGKVLSFMTWEGDEIMDAVKMEADRDIRELPGLAYDDLTWTETGMGMKELTPGNGQVVEDGQKVYLNYQGLLQDGTQFDNSFERNKPFKFVMGKGQVIPGFEEAVRQMTVGGSAWFYIPHHLAYGPYVVGEIPPFSNLWYKVEIVEVK